MGAIRITAFGGIIPRTSERLIPDNAAQIATNCRLSSGELEPFNAPALSYTSAKTGPLARCWLSALVGQAVIAERLVVLGPTALHWAAARACQASHTSTQARESQPEHVTERKPNAKYRR